MNFKQNGPYWIVSWGGISLGKPEFLLDFHVWSKLWNMSYILTLIPNMWDTCFLVLEHKIEVQLQWETYFENELEIYQTKFVCHRNYQHLDTCTATQQQLHTQTNSWIYYMLCEKLSTNQWQVVTTCGYQLSYFENIFPELSFNLVVSTQFQKLHLDLKT